MKPKFVIHPLDALSRRSPAAKADVAARERGHVNRSAATAGSEPIAEAPAPTPRSAPEDSPARQAIQNPGRPLAWARFDGARVVTAQEKVARIADGSAFLVEDFDIPLFAHPALTDGERSALLRLVEDGNRTPDEQAALRRILGHG